MRNYLDFFFIQRTAKQVLFLFLQKNFEIDHFERMFTMLDDDPTKPNSYRIQKRSGADATNLKDLSVNTAEYSTTY